MDKFNVAETFVSIKGEGMHTGVPMFFLRLAGCNVGRAQTLEQIRDVGWETRTGSTAEICTSWNGTKFLCDTDYNCHEKLSVGGVLRRMQEQCPLIKWCVITGGEPLMEANISLLQQLNLELGRRNIKMHFETNGTKPIPKLVYSPYIACSPKAGYLQSVIQFADELRLIIGHNQADVFPPEFLQHPQVLLSPENPAVGFDNASLKRCMELLYKHPNWRLNLQIHKYLGIL